MRSSCLECVPHLRSNPQDLAFMHPFLLEEFLTEGWLDAPAPLCTGGPFDPLLKAVMAAQSPRESSNHVSGPSAGHRRVYRASAGRRRVFRVFRATAGRRWDFRVFRATAGRRRYNKINWFPDGGSPYLRSGPPSRIIPQTQMRTEKQHYLHSGTRFSRHEMSRAQEMAQELTQKGAQDSLGSMVRAVSDSVLAETDAVFRTAYYIA
ncbi:hypothetical protein CRENBAI_022857 [Crenichthys baileyi]|uniref:Uncharacterized protein n=1 Tax=Crenichthys baileyi TaxID=28760 RepID=A0AAV9RHY6_9TELE